MENIRVLMNKPFYLGQAILDLSKTVMYKFHYDYMLSKCGENLQLCYMDTNSLVYGIKTDYFCKDIADDVELRFDTSGYSKNCHLPIEVNERGHWPHEGRTGRNDCDRVRGTKTKTVCL